MNKRELVSEKKKGLTISDVILIGVLLAAGAVLKFFVGSLFSAGMKPNFIIAMYCLTILLIKPRLLEAAVMAAFWPARSPSSFPARPISTWSASP